MAKRVKLIPLTKKYADILLKWRNSPHVTKSSFNQHKISKSEHAAWLNSLLKDKTRITFLIILKKEKKPIGKIGLKKIDLVNKRAELEKMIGEEAYQGKGYATEAARLLLKHVFKNMGLLKIYAHVLEFNAANIGLNKKIGFKVEGLLRKRIFVKNKFVNVVYMGLLREEFKNIVCNE